MNKKKGRFMKLTLVFMFIYLILFTIACLYITYSKGIEPKTLIISVFAFCGAEGGMSAWIKTMKEKKKTKKDDTAD